MYATLTDMTARYERSELVQLTDIGDTPTGEIDAARIATALQDATDEIDGYVAAKYRTGLPPVPARLVKLACIIARHALFRDVAPEAVVKSRDAAIAELRDIAKGVIKLDDGDGEELQARPGAIVTARPPRVFGRSSMEGF